ncbi:MAG: epoxide hydrolase [Renibacterium sp.]|nr:epoxide hydrolase [Renibacterium sp.]
MTTIQPYTVHIAQQELDDLSQRLRSARLPHTLPGDGWDTGIPSEYLAGLTEAWADHDWRATEARINAHGNFITEIEGQRIHFLHIRSRETAATPLLLIHGWPGSFLEFLDLIGPLTDPAAHGGTAAEAFHLVIPSIPGFGFSTPLVNGPWPSSRTAGAWVELMNRLGYPRFAVQGGDLGALIAPEVGRAAPERVIGVHVNGALGFPADLDPAGLSALEQDRLARMAEFQQREFGYLAIQSTRPGLIGTALTDSPVGQLAWILDKLRAWTHPLEAMPDVVLGLDWVLANVSLYWFTRSAGSAAYTGYASAPLWGVAPPNSGVPTAAIQFAHDIGIRSHAERSNTIVRWTDVPERGGHFAALEEPELLVADVRAFINGLEPATAADRN